MKRECRRNRMIIINIIILNFDVRPRSPRRPPPPRPGELEKKHIGHRSPLTAGGRGTTRYSCRPPPLAAATLPRPNPSSQPIFSSPHCRYVRGIRSSSTRLHCSSRRARRLRDKFLYHGRLFSKSSLRGRLPSRRRSPLANCYPGHAMAAFSMDAGYAMMTVNSQIIYKPTDQRDDPEPDNDHEVYVGNLPPHYTIEKFVRLAK